MTQYSDDDIDSAYGDDSLIGDDTQTLSTYITDYRYEFGRRYHSYRDGAYWVRPPSVNATTFDEEADFVGPER
jgi:hypothetical protein